MSTENLPQGSLEAGSLPARGARLFPTGSSFPARQPHPKAAAPGSPPGSLLPRKMGGTRRQPRAAQERVSTSLTRLPPSKARVAFANGKTAPGKPLGAGQPAET